MTQRERQRLGLRLVAVAVGLLLMMPVTAGFMLDWRLGVGVSVFFGCLIGGLCLIVNPFQ